jgi:hypothetical protein
MEPRALISVNSTPFKEQRDKDVSDLDNVQRALSEISLNNGIILSNTTNGRFELHDTIAKR